MKLKLKIFIFALMAALNAFGQGSGWKIVNGQLVNNNVIATIDGGGNITFSNAGVNIAGELFVNGQPLTTVATDTNLSSSGGDFIATDLSGTGTAVYGYSASGIGIYGDSDGTGVAGHSSSGTAGYFTDNSGNNISFADNDGHAISAESGGFIVNLGNGGSGYSYVQQNTPTAGVILMGNIGDSGGIAVTNGFEAYNNSGVSVSLNADTGDINTVGTIYQQGQPVLVNISGQSLASANNDAGFITYVNTAATDSNISSISGDISAHSITLGGNGYINSDGTIGGSSLVIGANAATIDGNGNLTATSFTGDGSGLTNLSAAKITGLTTNYVTGLTSTNGYFTYVTNSGSGAITAKFVVTNVSGVNVTGLRTQWAVSSITNAGNLAYSNNIISGNITDIATVTNQFLTTNKVGNLAFSNTIPATLVTGLPTTNSFAITNGTYPNMNVGNATLANNVSSVTNNIPAGQVTAGNLANTVTNTAPVAATLLTGTATINTTGNSAGATNAAGSGNIVTTNDTRALSLTNIANTFSGTLTGNAATATTLATNATVSGLTNSGTFTAASIGFSGSTPTVTANISNFKIESITGQSSAFKLIFSVTNAILSGINATATISFGKTFASPPFVYVTPANTNAIISNTLYAYPGIDGVTTTNVVFVSRTGPTWPVSALTTNIAFNFLVIGN